MGVPDLAAVEHDAGRAGVNQLAHAVTTARIDHVPRTHDVRRIVLLFIAPDAHLGSDVKDDVAVRTRGL